MSTPWYDYGFSQTFGQNGEAGVDLKTPFHTAITNLYPGQVVEAQYGGAGGIVGILTNVPGLGRVVEYFLHLDLINVSVGQQVAVGQQVGISGGETPAQAASGQFPGSLHPAQPRFSTGPHTEFGFFRGTPFASQDAGNPVPFLHPATGGAAIATTGTGSGSSGGTDPCGGIMQYPTDWINPVKLGELAICHATHGFGGNEGSGGSIIPGIAVFEAIFGTIAGLASNIQSSVERIGFFILALVFIIIGLVLIAYEPAQQKVGEAVQAAVKAAPEVAA